MTLALQTFAVPRSMFDLGTAKVGSLFDLGTANLCTAKVKFDIGTAKVGSAKVNV